MYIHGLAREAECMNAKKNRIYKKKTDMKDIKSNESVFLARMYQTVFNAISWWNTGNRDTVQRYTFLYINIYISRVCRVKNMLCTEHMQVLAIFCIYINIHSLDGDFLFFYQI